MARLATGRWCGHGWLHRCRGSLLPLAAGLALLGLGGCSAIRGAATAGLADGLSQAILNQEDPGLVRDGLPAYLILLDALVDSDPGNPRHLAAAAQLYALYGSSFAGEPGRSALLTARARDYGQRALCAAERRACGIEDLDYDAYKAVLGRLGARDAEALYSYSVASLAFIRAHSSDWTAIAGLPRVESALQRLLELPSAPNRAGINMYLGILNTLRPEALGGRPEVGRRYFEEAMALGGERDLAVKVEYARSYARLTYDRELHDRLLREVLATPVREDGQTLFNVLAQAEARELLASADDYF